ncbi:MmgE/PrpD family protein [Palleronia rufa]|uniref:MmgE/PrpD family protein n=1 Tax=Palleronia rufa TaxID=1530186 RepID=UPI00055FE4EF|nr:MmgE/PrpD family protein [Palleronia rufa]
MSVLSDLAEFAAGPIAADDTMRRFVGLSLCDWITVGRAGVDQPVSRSARALSDGDGATLFGGGRAGMRAAALINGATSHALDYDDTHFGHIGHPSVAVLPAALAVGEATGADAAPLHDAMAAGLETACRVGQWLGRAHYEAGFHQTGTSGAFGAAAAAGRLLALDPAAMAHALALTATRAAGLKSQFGTDGKPLNAGFAAEVGVTCALLAANGAVSARDALDGAQGFGPTHAGQGDAAALDGIGADWVFPAVSFKFHACCHGLHAMLEALREIRGDIDAAAVRSVTVRTHPRWFAVCNRPAPATGLEAKFSYRLTAAMALAGVDTAALGSFSDAICGRPDLIAIRDRVEVLGDGGLTDTQAVVTVQTDGRAHGARHDIAAAADPDRIEARLKAKSDALLGRPAARALWSGARTADAAGLARLLG